MKNTTRQLTHAAIFVIKEVAGAAVGSGRPLGWGMGPIGQRGAIGVIHAQCTLPCHSDTQ
jgi:hypothetical protein